MADNNSSDNQYYTANEINDVACKENVLAKSSNGINEINNVELVPIDGEKTHLDGPSLILPTGMAINILRYRKMLM